MPPRKGNAVTVGIVAAFAAASLSVPFFLASRGKVAERISFLVPLGERVAPSCLSFLAHNLQAIGYVTEVDSSSGPVDIPAPESRSVTLSHSAAWTHSCRSIVPSH